ncbi:hypothetical protein GCM10027160_06490 [Streptomyces calidiresistens]
MPVGLADAVPRRAAVTADHPVPRARSAVRRDRRAEPPLPGAPPGPFRPIAGARPLPPVTLVTFSIPFAPPTGPTRRD